VQWNSYDKQVDCFGKGQTDITASIQNDILTQGNDILVKGMVTDQSPGAKDTTRTADFPDGVPAVSDASMRDWMAYVYCQQAKPTNAIGVPVSIDVIDSNNNYRNIGTTTTDASGFYSFQWTPDISGKYTVIATFAGSQSYWGSSSETSFAVKSAPAATAAPTPTPASIADTYFVPAVAGIIIAIIIGFIVLALLMLRKRP
jgi:hypothetical protein